MTRRRYYQVKRKIEVRVEVRFDMRWQCRRVARVMTEVPPAAPRRQRAVRAPAVSRGCPLRERRLRSSGGEEPSRPTRRQVEAAPVTLPDGRLGPSSLTIHARLSGRPQAAVTTATVPLAQYSASSDPAKSSTVVHSQRAMLARLWSPCKLARHKTSLHRAVSARIRV